MNDTAKTAIVVVLIGAVIAVIAVRQNRRNRNTVASEAVSASQPIPEEYKLKQLTTQGLPTLIDLGASTCTPCKMMAPILEELKEEQQGVLAVHFLDVSVYPALKREYGVRIIPTQIFYDASGNERFRHEGFLSKQDILARCRELSVDLSQK